MTRQVTLPFHFYFLKDQAVRALLFFYRIPLIHCLTYVCPLKIRNILLQEIKWSQLSPHRDVTMWTGSTLKESRFALESAVGRLEFPQSGFHFFCTFPLLLMTIKETTWLCVKAQEWKLAKHTSCTFFVATRHSEVIQKFQNYEFFFLCSANWKHLRNSREGYVFEALAFTWDTL